MKRLWTPFFLGLAVGGAILLLPFETVLSHFVVDDTFYYLEIARNIALGNGPTFDGLHLTNGFQPLFQLLLVPIFWITDDLIVGLYLMKGLEAVLLGGIFAALFQLAARISPGSEITPWLAIGFLLLPTPDFHPFGAELVVGMESGLNFLLVVLTMLGLEDFHRQSSGWTARRHLGFGLVLGLLFLTRVDNALLIAAILPLMGWRVFKQDQAVQWRRFGLLLGMAAILAGGYLAWNWFSFGRLLPISGAIKIYHSAQASRALWQDGIGAWLRAGFWFVADPSPLSLLPLTGCLGWAVYLFIEKIGKMPAPGPSIKQTLLLVAIVNVLKTLAYSFLIQMNGFNLFSWYYVPEIVILCLLAGLGSEILLSKLSTRVKELLGLTAVGLLFIISVAGILDTKPRYEWEATSFKAVKVIRDTVPADVVIGSKDAGVLGYFLPNPVINLDGLVNDEAFFEVAQAGEHAAYIHAQGIDYLVNLVLPEPDERDFLFAWMGAGNIELLWQDSQPAEGTGGRVYKLYRVIGE